MSSIHTNLPKIGPHLLGDLHSESHPSRPTSPRAISCQSFMPFFIAHSWPSTWHIHHLIHTNICCSTFIASEQENQFLRSTAIQIITYLIMYDEIIISLSFHWMNSVIIKGKKVGEARPAAWTRRWATWSYGNDFAPKLRQISCKIIHPVLFAGPPPWFLWHACADHPVDGEEKMCMH